MMVVLAARPLGPSPGAELEPVPGSTPVTVEIRNFLADTWKADSAHSEKKHDFPFPLRQKGPAEEKR